MMKTFFSNRAAAELGHRELIRVLAADGQNRPLIQEFILRYHPHIRRSVIYSLRRRTLGPRDDRLRPEVDDFVNEVYCRLFQRRCQALRSFKGRHENSVLAYLHTISLNVVRNQFRVSVWQRAAQPLYFSQEQEERAEGQFKKGLAAFLPAEATEIEVLEDRRLEEMIYAKLAGVFRAEIVSRNFLIFKLRFLCGYCCQEIARLQALGLREKSVRNTAHSMRKLLRQKLAPENERSLKLFSRQACLSPHDLASYVGGEVYAKAKQRIETHLCFCQNCFESFLPTFNDALERNPQKTDLCFGRKI